MRGDGKRGGICAEISLPKGVSFGRGLSLHDYTTGKGWAGRPIGQLQSFPHFDRRGVGTCRRTRSRSDEKEDEAFGKRRGEEH